MKILIVDDAPDVLAWLGALLSRDGWQVFKATGGEAACAILESEDIRIVITDWMMPGMDGLSLIDSIRRKKPEEYVYTMLMTGRDREEDCIKGLASGADDYLVKPVSRGVLAAKLGVAQRILEMQQKLLDQQVRLRESRRMVASAFFNVRKELKSAAELQRAQLPGGLQLPAGVSADWRYQSARSLSGDHLDLFLLGKSKLGFYLMDVSGHGVSAALRSAAISELLRPISSIMRVLDLLGPDHVLQQLNQHLCNSSLEVEYLATLVLGTLNTKTGAMRIASAGHPCPLLLSRNGEVSDIAVTGLPLGVTAEAKYDTFSARLTPGDALLLYSDGLPDCQNPDGEHFGNQALRALAHDCAGLAVPEILDRIESGAERWRTGHPLQDDLTLLCLGLEPSATITVNTDKRFPAGGNGK